MMSSNDSAPPLSLAALLKAMDDCSEERVRRDIPTYGPTLPFGDQTLCQADLAAALASLVAEDPAIAEEQLKEFVASAEESLPGPSLEALLKQLGTLASPPDQQAVEELRKFSVPQLATLAEVIETDRNAGPDQVPLYDLQVFAQEDLFKIKQLFPSLNLGHLLRIEDARAEARKMATSIFKSYHELEAMLKSHEAVIQKRWAQKSSSKKKEMLRKAWPDMPACHRPEYEAAVKSGGFGGKLVQSKDMSRFADWFRFPGINLEDLSKPRPLLILLNARGRNRPHVFVTEDARTVMLALESLAVTPVLLTGYTMLFPPKGKPESYGMFVSWEEDEEAIELIYRQEGQGPGVGFEVLKVQDRLLQFLVTCSRLILHDVDWTASHPEQPAPDIPRSVVPLPVMEQSLEASYGVPAAIDLPWLERLIGAKLEAAQDHIIALREDPAYFTEILNEYQQHRRELVADDYGFVHPDAMPSCQSKLCRKALQEIVDDSHGMFEMWHLLHEQILTLKKLHSSYEDRPSTATKLPREIVQVFLRFESSLICLRGILVSRLFWRLPASPAFRHWFARLTPPAGTTDDALTCRPKPFRAKDSERQRLSDLVAILNADEIADLWGSELLIDELEHYWLREKSGEVLLSAHLAKVVSDLGIVAEALRQKIRMGPLVNKYDHASRLRLGDLVVEDQDRVIALYDIFGSLVGEQDAERAMPSSGKFNYPVQKRRTKENVEAMRSAEANLDALWGPIDQRLRQSVKRDPKLVALRHLFGQAGFLNVRRTPPWVPLTSQRQESYTHSSNCVTPLNVTEYYHNLEHRSRRDESVETVGTAAVKPKTRGVPHVTKAKESKSEPQADEEAPIRTYAVSRRAPKAFRTIFFVPNESSIQGELPWLDFLEAMKSAGMSAQKLQGSAWVFSPLPDSGHRSVSIQFHQPHPSPNVPFWKARRDGRRLHKEYGWTAEMFVAKGEQ